MFNIDTLSRQLFTHDGASYVELPELVGNTHQGSSSHSQTLPPAYSDLSSLSEAGSDAEDVQSDSADGGETATSFWRPFSTEAARIRFHHWLLMRGTRYNALPDGVLHTKRLFRVTGFVCLVLSMICIATAVFEPRWIDNIDTHQHLLPTQHNIDGHLLATRNSPPLPRSLGLWVQCSRQRKRGCVPVRPGQREVRYSLNYREVSAVALDSTYEFRAVQLTVLTAAVTLVVKTTLSLIYVFARRWSSIIWLRYSLVIMSALETLLLVIVISVFHTLHQNIGAGELSAGAGFLIAALCLCACETACFLMGVCHFSLTVEVDKPSRAPPVLHRIA